MHDEMTARSDLGAFRAQVALLDPRSWRAGPRRYRSGFSSARYVVWSNPTTRTVPEQRRAFRTLL